LLRYIFLVVLFLGLTPAAFADEVPSDNLEMASMFEADQEIRKSFSQEKANDQEYVTRMIAEDEHRRARTAALLKDGELRTANDLYRAAFIYQHGGEPSSYIMAHTLAVAAVARGHEKAGWISAATLDRYLQSIDQPQIYGTQTSIPQGQAPTMEPYDQDLIPDSLRAILGVPSRAAQDARLEQFRAMVKASN
jgi:hypothetical protein